MANQLLQSEVITRMINEQMVGKEKLMGLASDLGSLPQGVNAGDTYSIVKVAHLGEMVDLAKGDTIPTEDIQVTKSQETIEHKAKGVVLYDIEKETTIGGKSMLDLKIADMAELRVRAIEKSLGGKLANAPLTYASNAMNEQVLIDGIEKAFGDSQDADSFSGIVINSALASAFLKMDGFIKTDITYTADGNGVVRNNGQLGCWRGIPVVMSNVTTNDEVNNMYATYVIKKNSIGYKTVAGQVEVSRNASKKCDEVYDDLMFVTGVIDDTGVLVISTTK